MTRRHAVVAALAAALTLTACTPVDTAPAHLAAAATPTDGSWFDVAPYPREANGGVQTGAIVESVYDGDTLTVIRLARTDTDTVVAQRVKVRLAHIDAPEVRTSDADEKRRGHAARDRLRDLLPTGATVTMHDLGPDKYGRTLAQVDGPDGRNTAQVMLDEGHAIPYR